MIVKSQLNLVKFRVTLANLGVVLALNYCWFLKFLFQFWNLWWLPKIIYYHVITCVCLIPRAWRNSWIIIVMRLQPFESDNLCSPPCLPVADFVGFLHFSYDRKNYSSLVNPLIGLLEYSYDFLWDTITHLPQ